MNRIDLGYQARWEMLKVFLKRADLGGGVVSTFSNEILRYMGDLENADRPCLSRACEDFRSPATGDQRAVFNPIPIRKELPT